MLRTLVGVINDVTIISGFLIFVIQLSFKVILKDLKVCLFEGKIWHNFVSHCIGSSFFTSISVSIGSGIFFKFCLCWVGSCLKFFLSYELAMMVKWLQNVNAIFLLKYSILLGISSFNKKVKIKNEHMIAYAEMALVNCYIFQNSISFLHNSTKSTIKICN